MRKALALQPDDSTTLEDSIGFARQLILIVQTRQIYHGRNC